MGIESYPKVRVTTDVVVLTVADLPVNNARSLPDKGVQVMLIKRDAEPFKDEWTLPGGFVNYSTPLIETIYSKLEQKTGAKIFTLNSYIPTGTIFIETQETG